MKIYSKVDSNKILHIVYQKKEIVKDREDIIGPENFIQLSSLRMRAGKTFRTHRHIYKDGEERAIAQESWVVIEGKVKCYFYDLDNTLLGTWVLEAGDCSVTLEGGHNYEILEDDTIVYEYKTGPYKGQINDKVFIDEN